MSATARNPNHPKKGSIIRVEPIRHLKAISTIKKILSPKPRDLCLFALGINTALRANELLSITCAQVRDLKINDELDIVQSKTNKRRIVRINSNAIDPIRSWLRVHPNPRADAPLFLSRTGNALTVPTVSTMVKNWCELAGLSGNYGSHTLRKTWGYHALRQDHELPKHMVLPILVKAYGHARQEVTLEYLGIEIDEVLDLYSRTKL